MTNDQMREEFEAWVKVAFPITSPGAVEKHLDGRYFYAHVELAWGAWKAALASRSTHPAAGGGWISVSERLPERDVQVLVYVPGAKYSKFQIDEWVVYREDPIGMGGPTIETGEGWGEHDYEDVTHWRTLSPPPPEPAQ